MKRGMEALDVSTDTQTGSWSSPGKEKDAIEQEPRNRTSTAVNRALEFEETKNSADEQFLLSTFASHILYKNIRWINGA